MTGVAAEGRHHLFLKTTYLRDPAFTDAAAEAVEIHPALRAFGGYCWVADTDT